MYEIIIEQAGTGFSAFVPQLDGCVAAADTQDELLALMREAIRMHLEMETTPYSDFSHEAFSGNVIGSATASASPAEKAVSSWERSGVEFELQIA